MGMVGNIIWAEMGRFIMVVSLIDGIFLSMGWWRWVEYIEGVNVFWYYLLAEELMRVNNL